MTLKSSFTELPVEMMIRIFECLDRSTQKDFRSVCKHFCATAEPLLFSTVALDLDRDGCQGICNISSNNRIRKHVRRLRLQRRMFLKNLGDFDTWESSTIFSYDDPRDVPVDLAARLGANSLSNEVWDALSQDERHRLYEEYEQDRTAGEVHKQELASAAYSLLVDRDYLGHGAASQTAPSTHAKTMLDDLVSALGRLPNLIGLEHTPAYITEDQWGLHWRQLHFHPDAPLSSGSVEDEQEIEALQVLLVLHAIANSASPDRRLQFVELHTAGIAFWNLGHLCHLIDWIEEYNNDSIRPLQPLSDEILLSRWIDRTDRWSTGFHHLEQLTRQLCIVERAFAHVTYLDWTACCEEYLPVACQFLARVLQSCECLKDAKLYLQQHLYGQHHYLSGLPSSRTTELLTQASWTLLRAWSSSLYLSKLNTLELSIAVKEAELWGFISRLRTIRHIAFWHVALLPGHGSWNSLVRKMSENLKLLSVELIALEDVWLGSPRLILDPEAQIWKDAQNSSCSYTTYEANILDYVLGKTETFPVLSQDEFCERTMSQSFD